MKKGIVSIEDNKMDALVIKRTLKELTNENITTLKDGDSAIEFLEDVNNKPILILMDINLPYKNGFEILQVIRNYKHLSDVPVIMFSSSQIDEEIKKAYSLGANSFVSKPSNHEHLENIIREIYRFWFETAKTSSN